MPETPVFRCPCCGQLAPRDRLETEGPFPLEALIHHFGGKEKLTSAERALRKGESYRRGSGPGIMRYEEQEVDDELRNQFRIRIEEILERGL